MGRRSGRHVVGALPEPELASSSDLQDRYHNAERAMGAIHNQMPVILARDEWPMWLGEGDETADP